MGMSKGLSGFIHHEIKGDTVYITLNRQEKSNSYNRQMLDDLLDIVCSIEETPSILLVVIDSSSKIFCAGADLSEIAKRPIDDVLRLKSRRVFSAIRSLQCPTVAVVEGAAVAGGFELALSCDFIIATNEAEFWLTETGIGILPAAGGITRLVEMVGSSVAKKIIILGDKISASEAYRLGIVTYVIEKKNLMDELLRLEKSISSKSRMAVQIAKKLINDSVQVKASSSELIGQALLTKLSVDAY
ncbi:MAG: enoyl-CoA hydratase/isomerase family protein [Gammaproteobacteria bacterium]|nr:enoyl-CoA hydratase/isomerase family protein [Gammaproteobacteria bacterium]